MYKIIGSDGNEYGPVSAEQLKIWIAENRVEKTTPVKPEGRTDWVFLEALPEFAPAFMPPPSGAPRTSAATLPPAPVVKSKSAERPRDNGQESQDKQDNTPDPRENSRAWMAYCLGVVSVLPPFGALLGFPAVVLGIAGLRFLRRNPDADGRFHAWMGIILGGLFSLGYLALGILVIIEVVAHGRLTG